MTDAVLNPATVVNATGQAAAYVAADDDKEEQEEGEVSADQRLQVKLQGEDLLRRSGLTYFIVRPGVLEDRPGGGNLKLSQDLPDGEESKKVSRTDVAEVVVSSLLDPRACNVACSLTSSEYAKIGPEQDISKLLEVMQPNRM